MNFASDNWAGAHPAIAASLVEHASGFAPAYGKSGLDNRVEERLGEIFERNVSVFFVATGTAANALAATALARPGGVLLAHREAHIVEDECGAPEYLSGGRMRVHPVDGQAGRMDPERLKAAIARFPAEFSPSGQAAAVSLTQSTEIGTLYELDQIAEISSIARAHGLPLHMDGARFANALVALDATPAEMTWKRGVDVLSFGGTKNGCWCAEALIFFDASLAKGFPFMRKRAAQLFSKSRFVAAQFDAYLRDGLWLDNARRANGMAAELAARIEASASARLAWKPQANEVFAILPRPLAAKLEEEGAHFYDWPAPHGFEGGPEADEVMCRLVTSFATGQDEIDRFAALLG